MITNLIHNSVQVLLPSTVLIPPAIFPLFFQVCQELEHLRKKNEWCSIFSSCLMNVREDKV